jgi:putative membrane protein (TIGR04086 family)
MELMIRSLFYGILGALGIIFVVKISIILVNIWYTSYLFRTLSIEGFKQITHNPPLMSTVIYWIGTILSYTAYLLAGLFVVFKAKRRGWFYGGLVGLIWFVLSYLLILFYSLTVILLPNSLLSGHPEISERIKLKQMNAITDTFTRSIPQKMFSFSIIVGLTSLGGLLAEKIIIRNRLK